MVVTLEDDVLLARHLSSALVQPPHDLIQRVRLGLAVEADLLELLL